MKNLKKLNLSSKGNEYAFSRFSEWLKNSPYPYPGNITTDHRRIKRIYSKLHPKFYMFFVNYQQLYCDKMQKIVNEYIRGVESDMYLLTRYVWRKSFLDKPSKKAAMYTIRIINKDVEKFIEGLPKICHYSMLEYADDETIQKPDNFLLLDREGYTEQLNNITTVTVADSDKKDIWHLNPLISAKYLFEPKATDSHLFEEYYKEVEKTKHPKVIGSLFHRLKHLKEKYMLHIGGEKARWDSLQSPFTMEKRSKDENSDYKSHLKILEAFDKAIRLAVLGQHYLKLDGFLNSSEFLEKENRLVKVFQNINSMYTDLLESATLSDSVNFFSTIIQRSRTLFSLALEELFGLLSPVYEKMAQCVQKEYKKILGKFSETFIQGMGVLDFINFPPSSLESRHVRLYSVMMNLGYLPYSVHNHHRKIGYY